MLSSPVFTDVALETDGLCALLKPALADAEIIRFRQERNLVEFDIVQSFDQDKETDVFVFSFFGVRRFFYKTPFMQNVIMGAFYGDLKDIADRNPEILAEAIRMFDEGPYAKIEREGGIFFWAEPCADNNLIVHADRMRVQRRAPQAEDQMLCFYRCTDNSNR